VTVSGITTATHLSVGADHTCAVLADGTVSCWGANGFGKLGDGTTTERSTPVSVSGLSGAARVAAGGSLTCAVLSDGTARCWGSGGNGGLGDGNSTNSLTPVVVSGLTTASEITAGLGQVCAKLSDGSVRCWGFNGSGQIGDGTTTNRAAPVSVGGLTAVGVLSAGGSHTCATLTDGTARCWGGNSFGQLGDGGTSNSPVPVRVLLTRTTGSHPGTDEPAATPGLTVSCLPSTLTVGTTVTCTVGNGHPGIVILWQAATNPPFAGAGVALDAGGSGTFAFTIPRSALGAEITVELVDWIAPVNLGVVVGPIPTSLPAGDGSAPALHLLALLALACVIGAALLSRKVLTVR
jgi:hypothetical protein